MNTSISPSNQGLRQSDDLEVSRGPAPYLVTDLVKIREELDSIARWQVSASQALRFLCLSGIFLSSPSPTLRDARLIESLLRLDASNCVQIDRLQKSSTYLEYACCLLPFSRTAVMTRQFLSDRSSVLDLVNELIERQLVASEFEAITDHTNGLGGVSLFPYHILRPTTLGRAVACV